MIENLWIVTYDYLIYLWILSFIFTLNIHIQKYVHGYVNMAESLHLSVEVLRCMLRSSLPVEQLSLMRKTVVAHVTTFQELAIG